MHGMHARLPKNFVLEERLERFADAIELYPASYAGCWREACALLGDEGAAPYERIHVDLGCGKGAFVVQEAPAHPTTLFVAIDAEPICVAYTAQHVMEAGLRNVVVVPALGNAIARIFAAGEVGAITLNFPTPFPRKKDADRRLTSFARLLDYRHVLKPGGTVLLKTDSYPLWRFSELQFEQAGYRIHHSGELGEASPTATEYEQRLTAQGAPVFSICATPDAPPRTEADELSPSLVDYLPRDLEALDYVPHGMQGTVTNLRNQRARARKRR